MKTKPHSVYKREILYLCREPEQLNHITYDYIIYVKGVLYLVEPECLSFYTVRHLTFIKINYTPNITLA